MFKKIILFVPFLLYAGSPMLTDDPDVPNLGEVEINFSSQLEKSETVGFHSNKHNKIALKSQKMCKILSFIQYKT